MQDNLTEEQYWETTRAIFQDTELGLLDSVGQSQLLKLFKNPIFKNRELIMKDRELESFQNFPDTFIVYRGIGSDDEIDFKKIGFGMSWTLNKDTAKWFASRFNRRCQVLLKMEIKKSDVLAYFGDKGEDEIIIDTTNSIVTGKEREEWNGRIVSTIEINNLH